MENYRLVRFRMLKLTGLYVTDLPATGVVSFFDTNLNQPHFSQFVRRINWHNWDPK